MSALDHVRRMNEKYPNRWAGIGEIFFRHDDLTNLSLGRDEEIPRPDHPAMLRIYDYCQEQNMMVMMHHNLYRSGSPELVEEWQRQLYAVLEKYPDLPLLLCHTGISRLCWDIEGHHKWCDQALSQFPQLVMDISWVVYDSVICGKDGEVRQEWVDLFEKHTTRFTIGSDQVGRFSGSCAHISSISALRSSDQALGSFGRKPFSCTAFASFARASLLFFRVRWQSAHRRNALPSLPMTFTIFERLTDTI